MQVDLKVAIYNDLEKGLEVDDMRIFEIFYCYWIFQPKITHHSPR